MSQVNTPLVVDLDGTLIRSDLLIESFLGLLKKNPLYIFMVVIWMLRSRATLKLEIAKRVDIDVAVLPYNHVLIAYLKEQKSAGRKIYLATASAQKYADQVAEHLALFDEAFGTGENSNLKASKKAALLCEKFGEKGFVYAGDAKADLKVWPSAQAAVVVTRDTAFAKQVAAIVEIEELITEPKPGVKKYLKACRIHQWVKNALVFVPVAAAQRITEVDLILETGLAFLAFSLCASSVYLLNDLLDLDADRHHPSKRNRPFAAGTLPPLHGIFMIPVLLLLVAIIVVYLPVWFAVTLLIYYVLTTAYSFQLKKRIMLDVIVLAGLYTIRLVAGATATGITLSYWLLAFSMFIFLSLAMVKRYTELIQLKDAAQSNKTKGRGYVVDDLPLLSSLGGSAGYLSVLVFALYANSDAVRGNYAEPELLWAVCPILLFWISRVWVLAHRGQMDDDPIVFAIKDNVSRVSGMLIAAVLIIAAQQL